MKNENRQLVHIDMINHVWGKCIRSKGGKALFHGDTLAQTYMSEEDDWIDAFQVLRSVPELKISAFYIKGIREKIFEVAVNPIYSSPLYKEILNILSSSNITELQKASK